MRGDLLLYRCSEENVTENNGRDDTNQIGQ